MNALIVDDSPLLRKELREMLGRLDIDNVLEANDGNEAVELCEAEDPDIVLLDIVMEEADGITFLEEVEVREAVDDHAVVVISALDDPDVRSQAEDLGATMFIEKPVRMADVQDAIEQLGRQ